MTLLDALQKETEGEQVFAYPSHLHGFNAGRNILINNVGAAIVVVGMWCFVVSGLSKKGEMWASYAMLWFPVWLAIFATIFAIFTWLRYGPEIGSLQAGMADQIIIDGDAIWVDSGIGRGAATRAGLKRGSFCIYDGFSGLNRWRLHLNLGSDSKFYDPSKMVQVSSSTPYSLPPIQSGEIH